MRGLTNFFNSLRIQTLSPLTRAIVVALVFTGVGVVSAQTSPVTDLNAGTSAIREAIDLFWTAPPGAENYLIKYAEKEIVENGASGNQINWVDAISVENSIIPKQAGEVEAFTVENLTPDKVYYFAIKSSGEDGTLSEISNLAKAKAIPGFQDNGDGTITDLYTGLMWVKDGASSPAYNGATSTQGNAVSFCEQLNFAGYDDWRLPNLKELASIVHYAKDAPTVYENYFINIEPDKYWSSNRRCFHYSQFPGDLPRYVASYLNFSTGEAGDVVYDGWASPSYYFLPVRGQYGFDLVDNGDGTITDQTTGLIWAKAEFAQTFAYGQPVWEPYYYDDRKTWEKATRFASNRILCQDGTFQGNENEVGDCSDHGGVKYDDWRLPNIQEIMGVRESAAIFGKGNGFSWFYWSSTLLGGNEGWVADRGYNYSWGIPLTAPKNLLVSVQVVRDGVPIVTATIAGKVTDSSTGNPISGATVSTNGYSTTTDSNGDYSLNVSPGTYSVTVSASEYESRTEDNITVIAGDTTTVNFPLVPIPENQPPIANFTYSPAEPKAGEWVTFDASFSDDPDGEIVSYEWDWDGDGTYDESTASPITPYSWNKTGTFQVKLKVTDNNEATDSMSKEITIVPLSDIGCAIIVTGKGGKYITHAWDWIIDHKANAAYRSLRGLGFDSSSIYYLNNIEQDADDDGYNDVDGDPTLSNLERAITEWAPQRVGPHSPFILFMTGHGAEGGVFSLNDEERYPTGYDLKVWLGESSLEGIKTLIVIDACYSGSFITNTLNNISSEGRVIVTPTRDDQILHSTNWFSYRFFKRLQKGGNVLQAFITGAKHIVWGEPWLDDNGDAEGHNQKFLEQNPPESQGDEGWLASNMKIGKPSAPALQPERLLFTTLASPGELRIHDSEGQVTGLVNGNIKEEIPYSIYIEEDKTVIIFPCIDTYRYEVVGTETGEYGLTVTSVEGGEATTFTATDISTSPNAIHQYTIDWDALSQGENGVTVQIDSDGDSTFELTFNTGDTLENLPGIVNNQVMPVVQNVVWDPETKIFAFDIALANVGSEPLYPPMEAVISNLYPSTVTLNNPDGGGNGIGGYWDYSNSLGDGVLSPGETSEAKHWEFYNPDMVGFNLSCDIYAVPAGGGASPKIASAGENPSIGMVADLTKQWVTIDRGNISKAVVPTDFALEQNYPNPFNPVTTIKYGLPEDAYVKVAIYNVAGQRVATLVNGEQQAGYHQVSWDGKGMASGIYFYRIEAGEFIQTRKMILLK